MFWAFMGILAWGLAAYYFRRATVWMEEAAEGHWKAAEYYARSQKVFSAMHEAVHLNNYGAVAEAQQLLDEVAREMAEPW